MLHFIYYSTNTYRIF